MVGWYIALYTSFAVRLRDSMLSVLPYVSHVNCCSGKLVSFLSMLVQKLAYISSFLSFTSDIVLSVVS